MTLSLQRAAVATLAGHFLSHVENLRSGVEEDIFTSGPTASDDAAERWISDANPAESSEDMVDVPSDVAATLHEGVGAYLEDWASGIEEGIYEDPYPEGADAALEEFSAALRASSYAPSA